MIPETMIELHLLSTILENAPIDGKCQLKINGKSYNINAIIKRYQYLMSEFLNPYVIDTTSKED